MPTPLKSAPPSANPRSFAPFVRMLMNNAPRNYAPDDLPEQLLS
jgi:hypothetical protein